MGVGRYHGTARETSILKGVDFTREDLVGLEIEVHTRSGLSRNTVADGACANKPILAEEDGSLDCYQGIEFVFAPIPIGELTEDSFVGQWSNYVRDKVQAWKCSWHGMHISINATVMSNLHVGKFCHFFNNNKTFSVKMAGRDIRTYIENNPNYYNLPLKNFANCTPREMPATRRSQSRIEVRMFQSSTNFKRILKNCQLVDSVRVFTKTAKVEELTPDHYINWLGNNSDNYKFLANSLGVLAKV